MQYELMLIFKPLLPEDIRGNVQTKIENLIKKAKGKVVKQEVWGKRHLAYPIKKHEEGYYLIYDLEMPESFSDKLRHEIQLMSDIIRFLLVQKEK